MRYGSVCSGIEAATVAWHSLGWEPAFFSDIEKFPREVLAHHYPDVPLHGDFTTIEANQYGSIDLLVGGTPCQSFSIAGLRKGLDDDRGNLSLEFIKLAQRERPRWVVWENVPGVLSSNGGKDFGSFLGALGEIGYGFAYRVLDAQYFGVAQRRRRVFVVGYLGDWRRAAAVLFERESLRGNPAPSREKGQKPAPTVTAGPPFSRTENDRVECDAYVTARMRGFGDYDCDGTASTVKARDYKDATDLVAFPSNANADSMAALGNNLSPTLKHDPMAVALPIAYGGDVAGTLDANYYKGQGSANYGEREFIAQSMAVRRLTPTECERLQGFPDVKNSVIINVWSTEHQKNYALAETLSLRSQAFADNVSANASPLSANLAAQGLSVNHPDCVKPVAVNVLIDLERSVLQLNSPEKLNWSVNIADKTSSSLLPIPIGDFARLIAHMPEIQGRQTLSGKVGSLQSTRLSSLHQSGKAFVHLSGQEISEFVRDAEKLMTAVNECLKSTTLEVGQSSQSLGLIWETWSSCVLAAISGFIPKQTLKTNSFSIRIDTVSGYTNIKDKCPDGPRYKALGNSMAVPVMKWIGERIQMVDSL